jgi:hypothetical protein
MEREMLRGRERDRDAVRFREIFLLCKSRFKERGKERLKI